MSGQVSTLQQPQEDWKTQGGDGFAVSPIPKVIHFCWFGGKPYPPLVEKCMASWKKILPDYQIKRWDESNSPIEQCSFAKQAHEARKWAFVADYVRIYALYHEGGIYMDTDMIVLKPFDTFLHFKAFLGLECAGYANGAIVGAVKHHPFIYEVLRQYESRSFVTGQIVIPKMFSDILKEKGMTSENALQEVFGVHIYPRDYFYAWPFPHDDSVKSSPRQEDYMSFVTPNSYAVHLWDFTWRTPVDYFRRRQYMKGIQLLGKEIWEAPFLTLKKLMKHAKRFF